jgi:hypothetical protein
MTIGCLLANPIRFQRISAFLGRGQDKTGWKSTHFLKPGSASQVLRQLILMKKGVFKVGDPRDIGFHDENDHP